MRRRGRIVVCCGWNCGEKEILAEAFLASELARCRQWKPCLLVLSAHSSQKLHWKTVATSLALAPKVLLQTKKEDFPPAQENVAEFAGEWT